MPYGFCFSFPFLLRLALSFYILIQLSIIFFDIQAATFGLASSFWNTAQHDSRIPSYIQHTEHMLLGPS